MDRKIIVLTPSEWENRVKLGECAQKSFYHNHFNKDAQLIIKSLVWNALDDIKKGNIQESVSELEKVAGMCERIYTDSCRAQDGISELARLIEYDLEIPKAIDPTESPKPKNNP